MGGQRRNGTSRGAQGLELIQGGVADIGPCPEKVGGLAPLKMTRDAWQRMRETEHLGQLLADGLDVQILHRWIDLVDRRERALRAYSRQPLFVDAKTGKPSNNPAWQVVTQAGKDLLAIEDRLGGSPLSRMRLGIVVAEAGTNLQAFTRLFEDGDDDGSGVVVDPRLSAVDVDPR